MPDSKTALVLSLAFLLGLTATPGSAQIWSGSSTLGVEVKNNKGRAVAGATVTLEYQGPGAQASSRASGPEPRRTDRQGRASFTGLAEGAWNVEVSHPDHLSFVASVVVSAKRKAQIMASFLEASGRGRIPLRVKLTKGGGNLGEPVEPAPQPPRVVATRPEAPPVDDPVEVAPPVPAAEPATQPSAPPAPPVDATRADPDRREPRETTPASRPAPEPSATAEPERPDVPAVSTTRPPAALPVPEPVPEPEPEPDRAEPQENSAPEPRPVEATAPPTPPAAVPVEPETPIEPPEVTPPPLEPAQPDTPRPPPDADAPPSPRLPEPARPEPAAQPDPAVVAEPEPPRLEDAPASAASPAAPPAIAPAPAAPRGALRSYRQRTCVECKPGEWSVGAAAPVGAGLGGCDEEARQRAEDAIELIASRLGSELADYAGPILTPPSEAVLGRMAAADRARVVELTGNLSATASTCRLVAVAIPRSARFLGFRFEAFEGDRGGDCMGTETCPIGQARWLANPGIERSSGATFAWALFENQSASQERQVRLSGYFSPGSWQPPG